MSTSIVDDNYMMINRSVPTIDHLSNAMDHHNNRSWNNDYNPNLLAQSQNDLYSNHSFDANRSQIYRSHPSMIVALPNESSNQPSRASSQLQANSLSSECHYDDRYENRTPQSSSIGSYTIPSVSKSTLTLPIEVKNDDFTVTITDQIQLVWNERITSISILICEKMHP